jgi:hypothetical protein
LHGAGTERAGSGHAARICDTAGRDHRQAHGVDQLWHEREGAERSVVFGR